MAAVLPEVSVVEKRTRVGQEGKARSTFPSASSYHSLCFFALWLKEPFHRILRVFGEPRRLGCAKSPCQRGFSGRGSQGHACFANSQRGFHFST
jgi:hypothetical protein